MPTGYTAPVKDGEITSLTDFALTCARAFGAMVLLRDSDQSLEATRKFIEDGSYAENSSYNEDRLAQCRARLAELQAMSDEDVLAAAQKAHDAVVAGNAAYEEKRLVELARYEAMLERVEAWEPPTEDHVSFKEFMLSQLRESIEFDCRPLSMPVPVVSLAWRDEQIERATKDITYHEDQIQKERERNAGRVAWVTALLDSLETVHA